MKNKGERREEMEREEKRRGGERRGEERGKEAEEGASCANKPAYHAGQ